MHISVWDEVCTMGLLYFIASEVYIMSFISLLLLAIGLSMDAFAVAVCKGLASRELNWKKMVIVGLWFGGFQALMPTIGYFLGSMFEQYITAIDHWVAFVLLGAIGANMLRESFSKEEEEVDASFSFKPMLVMAIATSIDALAAGIPLPSLNVNIAMAAGFIGICTFTLSVIAVKVGNIFGSRFKCLAERAGGIILILLGTQILLEHLGLWMF